MFVLQADDGLLLEPSARETNSQRGRSKNADRRFLPLTLLVGRVTGGIRSGWQPLALHGRNVTNRGERRA